MPRCSSLQPLNSLKKLNVVNSVNSLSVMSVGNRSVNSGSIGSRGRKGNRGNSDSGLGSSGGSSGDGERIKGKKGHKGGKGDIENMGNGRNKGDREDWRLKEGKGNVKSASLHSTVESDRKASEQDQRIESDHAKIGLDEGIESDVWTSCGLDECLFSSGMISRRVNGQFAHQKLLVALSQRGEVDGPVTVHANYMLGNDEKKEGLSSNGYWLLHSDAKGALSCVEPKDDRKNNKKRPIALQLNPSES